MSSIVNYFSRFFVILTMFFAMVLLVVSSCKPDVKPKPNSSSSKSIPKFTLSFEGNNGIDIDGQSIEEGQLAFKPVDPRRADYTFAGWFKDSAFTQPFDFLKDPIEANLTLYAKWHANPIVTFTVNGGSAVANGRSFYNDVVSKPSDPTRANFTFGGWFSDSALSQAFDFNTKLTADITLYAKWNANPTITFTVNGGSAIASVKIPYDSKLTKPADPTRANFTFAGWFKNAGLTQAFDFNIKLTADTNIYAKWNANPTITFDVDGGSAVASVRITYDSKITKPADPTKTGYVFVNWYAENTYQNVFDFDTTITSDTTLYGKFNRVPVLKANANDITKNRVLGFYVQSVGSIVYQNFEIGDFISDPDGDTLTYSIVSAFHNGGNDDKKGLFSVNTLKITTTINPKNNPNQEGYYRIRVRATDTWGSSVDLYTPIHILNADGSAQTLDIASITTRAYLVSQSSTNYYRTGSGDDLFLAIQKGIYDGGSGDDIYRIDDDSTGCYVYNFKSGDKLQLQATNSAGTTIFKDYQFSSYTNPSDVVATGNDRIIYITSTGELYRDENGDAVYDSDDSEVDLKTGSSEHRIAKLYKTAYNPGDAAESNGTPADFDTDDFEIVDI